MNEVAKLQTSDALVTEVNGMAMQELFVINLCASMTPMPSVPKNLEGFEKYKLYQVSRQEDGRRRFRLRLGFFTSETDAEWVLNSVRNLYPAAFTGCITQEDLRYATEAMSALRIAEHRSAPVAEIVPVRASSSPVIAPKKVAGPETANKAPVVARSAPITAKASSPPIATEAPIAAVPAPATAVKPTLSLSPSEPITKPALAASLDYTQPFHVGRGVELPETHLELSDECPVLAATATPSSPPQPAAQKTAARSAPSPAATPAAIKTTNAAPQTTSPEAMPSAHTIRPPKVVDDYVPILDTTLTIRTLTRSEAEDSNRPKWFAIQLALSEQPVNLETMPKLDIFAAYCLYSVTVMEGHSIKHALRLGFFRETVSADAVMGYLKAFFGTPLVTQISSAEYDRFAESKSKPTAETDVKVVKLNGKRAMPAATTSAVTTTPTPQRPVANAVNKGAIAAKPERPKDTKARMSPPPRPQSFLSRLIGRQLD